jgi:hypothetical protein
MPATRHSVQCPLVPTVCPCLLHAAPKFPPVTYWSIWLPCSGCSKELVGHAAKSQGSAAVGRMCCACSSDLPLAYNQTASSQLSMPATLHSPCICQWCIGHSVSTQPARVNPACGSCRCCRRASRPRWRVTRQWWSSCSWTARTWPAFAHLRPRSTRGACRCTCWWPMPVL